jgi:hypothetical protein
MPRFANLIIPVLAHRFCFILLELRAVICSEMASFAEQCPAIGRQIRQALLRKHAVARFVSHRRSFGNSRSAHAQPLVSVANY